jgi:hypothetical protein
MTINLRRALKARGSSCMRPWNCCAYSFAFLIPNCPEKHPMYGRSPRSIRAWANILSSSFESVILYPGRSNGEAKKSWEVRSSSKYPDNAWRITPSSSDEHGGGMHSRATCFVKRKPEATPTTTRFDIACGRSGVPSSSCSTMRARLKLASSTHMISGGALFRMTRARTQCWVVSPMKSRISATGCTGGCCGVLHPASKMAKARMGKVCFISSGTTCY